jgi:hypothetical protein
MGAIWQPSKVSQVPTLLTRNRVTGASGATSASPHTRVVMLSAVKEDSWGSAASNRRVTREGEGVWRMRANAQTTCRVRVRVHVRSGTHMSVQVIVKALENCSWQHA